MMAVEGDSETATEGDGGRGRWQRKTAEGDGETVAEGDSRGRRQRDGKTVAEGESKTVAEGDSETAAEGDSGRGKWQRETAAEGDGRGGRQRERWRDGSRGRRHVSSSNDEITHDLRSQYGGDSISVMQAA
jgi:hypothetical protein